MKISPGCTVVCIDNLSCMFGDTGRVLSMNDDRCTVRWAATGTIGQMCHSALRVELGQGAAA